MHEAPYLAVDLQLLHGSHDCGGIRGAPGTGWLTVDRERRSGSKIIQDINSHKEAINDDLKRDEE
jgi:hypothetical protein